MNKNWSNNSYTLLDIAPSELAAYIWDIPLHKTGTRKKKYNRHMSFKKTTNIDKSVLGITKMLEQYARTFKEK
jgi:hypothetical protein